jgi:hypothetical protein
MTDRFRVQSEPELEVELKAGVICRSALVCIAFIHKFVTNPGDDNE